MPRGKSDLHSATVSIVEANFILVSPIFINAIFMAPNFTVPNFNRFNFRPSNLVRVIYLDPRNGNIFRSANNNHYHLFVKQTKATPVTFEI